MITKLNLYEKTYNNINIRDIITEKEIAKIFSKYYLSCNPSILIHNDIEYNNSELTITCMFTSYYPNAMPKNILKILDKIKKHLCAISFDLSKITPVGTVKFVTFYFSNEGIEKFEIKKSLNKYNI
jgi:hypothetical protein